MACCLTAPSHYLNQCWPMIKGVLPHSLDLRVTSQKVVNPWNEFENYIITTRTTRTPAFWWYPPLPHNYPYYWVILDPKSKEDQVKVTNLKNWPKFQFFKFWNKHYTWHTFSSCLIRLSNMKRIWQVLLKIQSGHDSVHRRTDGQGETSISPLQLRWSVGYNYSHIFQGSMS